MKGNETEILLRNMQEYSELTDRVKAIYGDQMTLKDIVDVMERIIREPGRKDPDNSRILTYDETAMWDQYRKIGTPEELAKLKEKEIAKRVIKNANGVFCPRCWYWINHRQYVINAGEDHPNRCEWCGQKLDWEEEK